VGRDDRVVALGVLHGNTYRIQAASVCFQIEPWAHLIESSTLEGSNHACQSEKRTLKMIRTEPHRILFVRTEGREDRTDKEEDVKSCWPRKRMEIYFLITQGPYKAKFTLELSNSSSVRLTWISWFDLGLEVPLCPAIQTSKGSNKTLLLFLCFFLSVCEWNNLYTWFAQVRSLPHIYIHI
jgi:hypothetical protein